MGRHLAGLSLVAGALAVLGAYGHRAYWPRERPSVPEPGGPAALLAAPGGPEVAAWLAHPHQNLGLLARRIGDPAAALEAAGRLVGISFPDLPSFGPFGVPPSRSLAVVWDRRGDSFLLAARIDPVLAPLARWAGRLAGNPWLKGGQAVAAGRVVEVGWRGGIWTAAAGEASWPERPLDLPGSDPSLAFLRLGRPAGPLPAGLYRLARRGRDLELAAGPGEEVDRLRKPTFPEGTGLALLAVGSEAPGEGGLMLFREPGALPGLPAAAAFHRPGGRPWPLPGEGVLSLLRGEPGSVPAGRWILRSFDPGVFPRASAAVEGLSRRREEAPGFGLWVDLPGAREAVGRLAATLEELPVVGRREARPWRDAELLLASLGAAGCERLSLTVARGGGAALLRFQGSASAGGAS